MVAMVVGGANQHFQKTLQLQYYSPDIILLFVGVNKKRWEYYQQPQAEAEDALEEDSTGTTLLISILEPPVVA